MAVDIARLRGAGEELQSAVLLGRSWGPALESLAAGAGAKAVAFSRSTDTQVRMLPSQGLEEACRDIRCGRTPPYSSRVLILGSNDFGFVSDGAPQIRERLERETFFRDYMRPVADVPFRASASLVGPNDLGGVKISFWREVRQGCFDTDEVARLNIVLPGIRAAAQLAQHGFAQQAREQAVLFQRRGEFVFELDFMGRPLERSANKIAANGDPLTIVRGRLVSALGSEQPRIDALIRRSLSGEPSSGAIRLTRKRDGGQSFLLIVPVTGEAGDVFAPVAAIGVLIDPERKQQQDSSTIARLKMAVGLTDRESEVGALVSIGASPPRSPEKLGSRRERSAVT